MIVAIICLAQTVDNISDNLPDVFWDFKNCPVFSFADQRSQSFSDNHVSGVRPSVRLSVRPSVNFGGTF